VLIDGAMMSISDMQTDSLLGGITRAVLVAGLVAGLVALALAGLFVRQITRPLAALNEASRRIAAGDLSARVLVKSRDELGNLAQAFNRMAASLQTQETLRRNLVADIAHELRTPLAGIQGTVEALEDGIFPLVPENLEPIHEQVTVLNRLVEDLRTIAHAEAGSLALNLAPVDLAELARNQAATFQSLAVSKQVQVVVETPESLPEVPGDSQRLGQVLGNLLNNALRHTPAGGTIRIVLQPKDGMVQLAVLDTGEGIPAEDLPFIFDRFFRADRSRSRETGGSGLGLAIARQLVEAHGGRIWAESPPQGQSCGTGVYVMLPVAQQSVRKSVAGS
jgi:signal transduction histidine kinase